MKSKTVKGDKRAKLATILMMIGLGCSAFLINAGSRAPGLPHSPLATAGLVMGACMLALTSVYCFYLAIGAVTSKQFPSPTAFVPTDCVARSGTIAVAAAACLNAVNGAGLMLFAVWIVVHWL